MTYDKFVQNVCVFALINGHISCDFYFYSISEQQVLEIKFSISYFSFYIIDYQISYGYSGKISDFQHIFFNFYSKFSWVMFFIWRPCISRAFAAPSTLAYHCLCYTIIFSFVASSAHHTHCCVCLPLDIASQHCPPQTDSSKILPAITKCYALNLAKYSASGRQLHCLKWRSPK